MAHGAEGEAMHSAHKTLSRWGRRLTLAGLCFAVVACSTPTPTPTAIVFLPTALPPADTPVPSKHVTVTLLEEPDELNPLYARRWASEALRDLWLLGLWNFDEQGRPVPQLASEMPSVQNGGISPDGMSITVKLDPQIRWSDSEPLTSSDFRFTYEMIVSDRNQVQSRSPYADYVAGVDTPDDHTLVIRFQRPYANWLTGLFRFVLPEHTLRPVFEAKGTLDTAEWNRRPIPSLGPFVPQEWQPGQHLVFAKNPSFVRPPKVDSVRIELVPDPASQAAALKLGRTDIGMGADSVELANLQTPDLAVPVATGFNEGWFLNVNPRTAHPALSDVRVRRALALAVDRGVLTQELLKGFTQPPATYWDTNPIYANRDLAPYPYDPTEADRLLVEAGWVDHDGDGTRDKAGVELVLRYATNPRPIRGEVQARAAAQWAALGIGLTPVTYPSDVFWNSFGEGGPQATGQYDIAEYSSKGRFPNPEVRKWTCAEIPGPSNPTGVNWQGYCNKDLDALFDAQATTVDPDQRLQIIRRIQSLLYEQVIWIGLWKDPDVWGVSPRMQNVRLSGITPFWNAPEWDIGTP